VSLKVLLSGQTNSELDQGFLVIIGILGFLLLLIIISLIIFLYKLYRKEENEEISMNMIDFNELEKNYS